MLAGSDPQSMVEMWLGTCSSVQLQNIFFVISAEGFCEDSSSLRFSMTSCSKIQERILQNASVSTRRIATTGSSGTFSLLLRISRFCKT